MYFFSENLSNCYVTLNNFTAEHFEMHTLIAGPKHRTVY